MNHYGLIDALKILASQLIVLHHFSNYGPLSDALEASLPHLSDYLYEYGRMMVQAFLVIGGFLAVRSIAPEGAYRAASPGQQILRRYRRLAPPFCVALMLAVLVSALVRKGLPYEFVPLPPEPLQVLWHVLLLHTTVGAESLSAGVWYMAIDFQLYSVLLLLLWLGGGRAQAGVLGLTLASIFGFNLNTELDHLPWYFFNAYGLGVLAWWVGKSAGKAYALQFVGLALIGGLGLAFDFRERLLLALVTALALAHMQHHIQSRIQSMPPMKAAEGWPGRLLVLKNALARSSYALFLVHFPVLLLANWAWEQIDTVRALGIVGVMGLYWAVSLLAGWAFERWVERPLALRLRA